ncbi:LysR family transcriptional regulator, partial [Vibrio alfacsensis]
MLKLDFNSLKLLKILGEEKNTKRAGERLFISQPAVSKSL